MSYTLNTTTGQGAMPVACNYEIDSDGNVNLLSVIYQGIDILDAITEEQADVLVDSCAYDYEQLAREANEELAIEQHLQRQAA